MVDHATEQYLNGRIRRAEERVPLTLKNNQEFFSQYTGTDLDTALEVYNHVIQKVNWQGRHFIVEQDFSDKDVQEGLAKKLTDFQEAVDNLDRD